MKSRRKKNKYIILIIGILLLFLGTRIIVSDIVTSRYIAIKEEQAIQTYYQFAEDESNISTSTKTVDYSTEKDVSTINYIAILRIPKINLERGLVDRNNYLNNVKYNIEILESSSMPDEETGNVILAAHSGNSRVAYFKDLDKLSINDEVSIDYEGNTYNYRIINIYDIEKTGKAKIIRNTNISTLTMITCRQKTNKQIVIICELVSIV